MTAPPTRLWRAARRAFARLPSLRMASAPDVPALPVRDPWPGDAARGAQLLMGTLARGGGTRALQPGGWTDPAGAPLLRVAANDFTWLRDLRALGNQEAILRARILISDWIATGSADPLAQRPDVAGARIAAWLGHYDFFGASADDAFRQRMMARLLADARGLSAALPTEEIDSRALTALKGLLAAAVAMPEHGGFLLRAQRFLPQELARQILPDGSQAERSPAALLAALQDLTEIRALLQSAQAAPPAALAGAIERVSGALRTLRHGDGGLALFNGSREEVPGLIDLALTQAGRLGRAQAQLPDGGFHRLAAGRSLVIADCGAPPPPGLDRRAHAGTLSFEMSVGRERLIVNCGAFPAGGAEWRDAVRRTAAHSTLALGDASSSEIAPEGLGRRPGRVEAQRQEANGAHWLEASHDGFAREFGAMHLRRLYLAESGEDLRGEDVVEAPTGQGFAIRFHLHPAVTASAQQDGAAVLLRLPGGGGWRLRADGAAVAVEESIYLGGETPRRSEQVVLRGAQDGPQHVKWAISRVK